MNVGQTVVIGGLVTERKVKDQEPEQIAMLITVRAELVETPPQPQVSERTMQQIIEFIRELQVANGI